MPVSKPQSPAGKLVSDPSLASASPCWVETVIPHAKEGVWMGNGKETVWTLNRLLYLNVNYYYYMSIFISGIWMFFSHFIICISRIEIEDSEAVGISNIISNLITMFPRSILTALPNDLFTSFINSLTLLTCSFGRSAALEEVVSNDTNICLP